jgi:hypothetical protein
MSTKHYVYIALALLGGIAAGIFARGYTDQKGWSSQ